MTSKVYFIAGGGLIKIGYSRKFEARLKTLQMATPHPLEVIATFPGGISLEEQIHLELQEHRRHGEWFEDCPAVR
ncbi:MAG: GIY-YIG nuclease family protein, partial [Novosphingobium sp.]|nr:GIY-YIG nuclease family protein [Novosphingobium sp.]